MNRWSIIPIRKYTDEDCEAKYCRRVAERMIVWRTGKRTQGRIAACQTHARIAAEWK